MKNTLLVLLAVLCGTFGAAAQSVSGPARVCMGSTATLTGTPSGGTFSEFNAAVATVDAASGVVTPVAPGIDTFYYTAPGGSIAAMVMTIDSAAAPIIGQDSLCVGVFTIFFDSLGSSWISSDTSVLKIDTVLPLSESLALCTARSPGAVLLTFATSHGCTAEKTIRVLPMPSAISGGDSVCLGSTLALTDTITGGTWYSGNDTIASVDAITGIVTGKKEGTTGIFYATFAYGCQVGMYLTVSAAPRPGAIFGTDTLCAGRTGSLYVASADPGTWSSSNTAVATVSGVGEVTAVSTGAAVITYTAINPCGVKDTAKKIFVEVCPDGVAGAQAVAGLTVVPNPGNGLFSCIVQSALSEQVHIVVTNMMGQQVAAYDAMTNEAAVVNLNGQPAGMYLLSASSQRSRYTARILMQ